RWSPIVAKAGWTPIANVFIENYCKLDINPNEAMFLIHCFMYKWTVDKPYVSLTKVSIQMGKSRDTVQRYAKELEKKGFIKRIYRTRLPSLVNLNPLIKAMETFAIHPTLTKVPMQNIRTTYAKAHTKEEPLRRTITEFNKSKGIQHISEVMTWRK
ncbi:hypothetical protein A2274_03485, partial [candidate division WWE3 bacterium RIFOXYA12_FULL_43_11]